MQMRSSHVKYLGHLEHVTEWHERTFSNSEKLFPWYHLWLPEDHVQGWEVWVELRLTELIENTMCFPVILEIGCLRHDFWISFSNGQFDSRYVFDVYSDWTNEPFVQWRNGQVDLRKRIRVESKSGNNSTLWWPLTTLFQRGILTWRRQYHRLQFPEYYDCADNFGEGNFLMKQCVVQEPASTVLSPTGAWSPWSLSFPFYGTQQWSHWIPRLG